MKAAVLEQPGELQVKEVPRPSCPPDGVLIRVDACGVCNLDLQVLQEGTTRMEPPVVLGRELTGTIVEVGGEVHGYYDSERIAVASQVPCGTCHYCRRGCSSVCEDIMEIGGSVPGAFAEYMAVPGRAVRHGGLSKVPSGLSVGAAALAEPLACCLNAQETLGVGVGDKVLVIGAGPAGCLNALLARVRGASRVFMADRLANRLELAEVAGADLYVNTAEQDLRDLLMKHTDDRGADVVIVACGSRRAQQRALGVAASAGRICFFGALAGQEPSVSLDANLLHCREQILTGTHGATPAQHYNGLQLMAGGHVGVEKVITHRFGLGEIQTALEVVERRDGLKVIVEPAEEP